MNCLDESWFKRYQENNFSDLAFLTPVNLRDQKRLFLNNEVENPNFNYVIDFSELETKTKQIQQFIDDLKSEKHELVRNVYNAKLLEQLKTVELIKNIAKSEYDKFTSVSKELYGAPNMDLVCKASNLVASITQNYNQPLGKNLEFIQEYKDKDVFVDFTYEPKDNSTLIDARYIQHAFEERIKALGLSKLWKVNLDGNVNAIAVDYNTHVIFVPDTRRMSEASLEGLIAHEIDTHLLRFANGQTSPLLLLSLGLAQYLKGEEGIALFSEISKFKNKLPGVGNYLAVFLAHGSKQKEPLTFRETFSFLKEYFMIQEMLGSRTNTLSLVDEKAWMTCVKVFRGTRGDSRGVCYTRELVYFTGFNDVTKLVNSQSKELNRWHYGKYDPANDDHVAIIDALEKF